MILYRIVAYNKKGEAVDLVYKSLYEAMKDNSGLCAFRKLGVYRGEFQQKLSL